METLLFFAPPVLLVLIGLKCPLMTGWRLFVCGGCALYLGVWLTPAWYGLLDFLPPEIEGFRIGGAAVIGTLALFGMLFAAARALPQRKDDEFSFPKGPSWVLNALCRMCFGIFFSTLVFLFCAATPLRAALRNNGNGFEILAASALRKITAVGDALTLFSPEKPREQALKEFWYAVPAPKTAEPAKKTPQKKVVKAPDANPQNRRRSYGEPDSEADLENSSPAGNTF